MKTDKETGTYYTPPGLVTFMVEYLKKKKQDFSNVLEPSVGDGRFLSELLSVSEKIKAVEVSENKVRDVRNHYRSEKLEVIKEDFLEYAAVSSERFSLIIGNPPYISPRFMDKNELTLARKLCELEGLGKAIMQNMWLAFVVGAVRLLNDNGSIFFVLPMEFLQVQYAEKLRIYLERKFNIIHILSFRERIFPNIEQDICLVYLANESDGVPYILYEVYQKMESIKPMISNKIEKSKPLKKWSNAVLQDKDIILLGKISERYKKIKEMGESAPGIVTGGNKFFILAKNKVIELECEKYTLPIIQKNSYIGENTIIINKDMLIRMQQEQKPVYLLNLSEVDEELLPEKLKEYLEEIKETEVHGRKLKEHYKCVNRTPWYGVPIVNKGDVIFFRRYHILPRIYVNCADIHTTDAGYHIRLKETMDKESFVFCLYNSLTLAQCEFHGRFYGGGVGELVPSEFKELTVPYRRIKQEDIETLDNMFREKQETENIVNFVNSITIEPDIGKEAVTELERIRRTLISRRCSINKSSGE